MLICSRAGDFHHCGSCEHAISHEEYNKDNVKYKQVPCIGTVCQNQNGKIITVRCIDENIGDKISNN
jgi:hypothetical protein